MYIGFVIFGIDLSLMKLVLHGYFSLNSKKRTCRWTWMACEKLKVHPSAIAETAYDDTCCPHDNRVK